MTATLLVDNRAHGIDSHGDGTRQHHDAYALIEQLLAEAQEAGQAVLRASITDSLAEILPTEHVADTSTYHTKGARAAWDNLTCSVMQSMERAGLVRTKRLPNRRTAYEVIGDPHSWSPRKPGPVAKQGCGCGTHAGYERHTRYGEDPCEQCREAEREYRTALRRRRGVKPRAAPRCGTVGGYSAHLRRGEATCDACRAAIRERDRQRRRARGMKPKTRPPCGTVNGYAYHRHHGEPACDECLAALREDATKRRRARGVPERAATLQPCGTAAAAQRHYLRGEPLCDPCREAKRAAEREAGHRRRQAAKAAQ